MEDRLIQCYSNRFGQPFNAPPLSHMECITPIILAIIIRDKMLPCGIQIPSGVKAIFYNGNILCFVFYNNVFC